MEYPYPEDEFDQAAKQAGHRGVHRTPRSTWAKVWPFLAIVVIFPLLGWGVVTLGSRDRIPAPPSVTGPVVPTEVATAVPSTDVSPAPDPAGTGSQASATPTAPAPAPSASAAGTVTHSAAINIYNAAKINGLAAAAKTVLTTAGFTKVDVGNYSGATIAASTVYYASEDLAATAQEVAKALKITRVMADEGTLASHSLATGGVVAVLTADFRK